jgi:hypothetical protein
MYTDEWLEPRTIDGVLDLVEGFLEEQKLVLELKFFFLNRLVPRTRRGTVFQVSQKLVLVE